MRVLALIKDGEWRGHISPISSALPSLPFPAPARPLARSHTNPDRVCAEPPDRAEHRQSQIVAAGGALPTYGATDTALQFSSKKRESL